MMTLPRSFSTVSILCLSISIAFSQTIPRPKLATMFPRGLQAGNTATIELTGSDLDRAKSVLFADAGLKGQITKTKPLTISVTAEKTVPLGIHDLRIVSADGVTNALSLIVGTLKEANETEPNSDVPQANAIGVDMTVNGVINAPTDVDYFKFTGTAGQMIRVQGRTGSIETKARTLIELYTPSGSRLVSARPGDSGDTQFETRLPEAGDYLLRVCEFAYQTGGAEHGYRLTIQNGRAVEAISPFVMEKVPLSTVQVKRKGEPMAQVPFERSPGPIRFGRSPQTGLTEFRAFTIPGEEMPWPMLVLGDAISHEGDGPNDSPANAEALAVPGHRCGWIERANDVDWFKITAKKGRPLMITLKADRIGSPIDAYLSIRNAKTNQEIAGENQLDDDNDNLHPIGFANRSLDPPPFRFDPPADGEYLVRVATRDSQFHYGPKAFYVLSVREPKPAFQVVAMPRSRETPSGVNVWPGMTTVIDLYANREDGYAGPINVTAKNLPPGVTAEPAVIGQQQKWGMMLLNVSSKPALVGLTKFHPIVRAIATESFQTIELTATAKIDEGVVERGVIPATIVHGIPANANNPARTRIDQSLPVAVVGRSVLPRIRIVADLKNAKNKDGKPIESPFTLKPNEKAVIPIKLEWSGPRKAAVQLSLEPTHSDNARIPFSGNNANTQVTIPADQTEPKITLEIRPNAVPGVYRAVIRGDIQPPNPAFVPTWTTIDVTVNAK